MSPQHKVLLVDDERKFIESLARLLKRKNILASTVFDGVSALETLKHETFDAIIVDLRMPNMDGLATIEAIRCNDSRTPIILLTGEIDLERVSRALKGGVEEVLLKPCPLDILVSSIENACEKGAYAHEFDLACRSGGV